MTENEPEDTRPPAELMLVQVSEDAALVFGADAPSWLEVQPILGATSADRAHLHEAAALAVGGLNVALQVSPALLAAQGIVQLSPTTMTALRTLEPIVGANGWNIGTLRAAGKFAHSVQWAPASGAAGLQFASNLGPAHDPGCDPDAAQGHQPQARREHRPDEGGAHRARVGQRRRTGRSRSGRAPGVRGSLARRGRDGRDLRRDPGQGGPHRQGPHPPAHQSLRLRHRA